MDYDDFGDSGDEAFVEWMQAHTHSNPHNAELEGAAKAYRGAKILGEKIIALLEAAGPVGLTPEEFAEATGKLYSSVVRRFTILWKDGIIRHHPEGLERKNKANNSCVVWVMGRDPNLVPSRLQVERNKNERLRLTIYGLKAEIKRLQKLLFTNRIPFIAEGKKQG